MFVIPSEARNLLVLNNNGETTDSSMAEKRRFGMTTFLSAESDSSRLGTRNSGLTQILFFAITTAPMIATNNSS